MNFKKLLIIPLVIFLFLVSSQSAFAAGHNFFGPVILRLSTDRMHTRIDGNVLITVISQERLPSLRINVVDARDFVIATLYSTHQPIQAKAVVNTRWNARILRNPVPAGVYRIKVLSENREIAQQAIMVSL